MSDLTRFGNKKRTTPKRLQYLKDYGKAYRAKKKAERQESPDLEATPVPESFARGRRCRTCGERTEAKSYWYCHVHNRLAGVEEIVVHSSAEGIAS